MYSQVSNLSPPNAKERDFVDQRCTLDETIADPTYDNAPKASYNHDSEENKTKDDTDDIISNTCINLSNHW